MEAACFGHIDALLFFLSFSSGALKALLPCVVNDRAMQTNKKDPESLLEATYGFRRTPLVPRAPADMLRCVTFL